MSTRSLLGASHDALPAVAGAAASAPSAASPRARALAAFVVLSYAAVVLQMLQFAAQVHVLGAGTVAFAALLHLVYAAFFTSAATLPALVAHWVTPVRAAWATWTVRVLAVAGTGTLQLFLFADGEIFRRYGNHFNGMIWNLLTTRGGIESLDADRSSWIAFWGLAAALFALQAGLLAVASRWTALGRRIERLCSPRASLSLALLVLVAHGVERVSFGLSYGASYRPVTTVATAYPLYQTTRLVSLTKKLGLAPARDGQGISAGSAPAHLAYPLKPLARRAGARDLNVVWLVAESLRWDMLTEEVMPETMRFAAGGRRFLEHRSAGNGTRMGMFGMFYGLYGSYWFPFLAETRGPAVIDAMLGAGYDAEAWTSAKFTFPEFDRTIFAKLPPGRLHEGDPDLKGWENDRAQVTALLDGIDAVPAGTPFFRFQFFESPHAPYVFPKESVIRPDYARRVNYVTMDLGDPAEVERIRARYVNACHHLDAQLARIFRRLEERGLLDSTVVIVTGDHGEEFMEHGRWGHHSDFTEQQIRTPLVLRAPGVTPGVVTTMSSHLDLPATVLSLLGYENAPSDHSYGVDLLGGAPRADTVVSDWENLCLVDASWKIVLPLAGSGWSGDIVTTASDARVADSDAAYATRRDRIVRLLRDLGRFGR